MITIITATFNAAADLARTARSIRTQSYRHIQWVVIDGGSVDGTVEEIRANSDIIDYWVSEPDGGIYDAWNKGCARISGEWVLFIGAGDEFARTDTLEACAVYLTMDAGRHEIVYGRIELVSPSGAVIAELGEPWQNMKGKWGGLLPLLPPHPSSFHHRALFARAPAFDTRFRYAGDTAFVLESVLRREPLYIPVLVDRMLTGGVSVRPGNILRIAKERRDIARGLRVKAPALHSLAWAAAIAGQLASHYLLPATARRALRALGARDREQRQHAAPGG